MRWKAFRIWFTFLGIALWWALLPGCGDSPSGEDADAGADARIPVDGGVDAARDAEVSADASVVPDGGAGPCDCGDDDTGWTFGRLTCDESASPGYTLFAPIDATTTYLVDTCGRRVHSWESTRMPEKGAYLQDDGLLLRAEQWNPLGQPTFPGSTGGGVVTRLDWDGTVVWEYEYHDDRHLPHHDIEPLPNGNVLIIAWERKTGAEAVAAGRSPTSMLDDELWPDTVVEVQPLGTDDGTVVWEWHVWDHLIQDYDPAQANYGVVEDHPELIDLNFWNTRRADWNHLNSVAYDADLDQIVVTSRAFSEVWLIDHSTTTAEAAGHTGGAGGRGGDLLYRWGNPQTYRAGPETDKQLFAPHHGHWIPAGLPGAGNLLVFNNGQGRPVAEYSSVDELVTPVDAGGRYPLTAGTAWDPAAPLWSFSAPAWLASQTLSSAQRLANGNTLVCEGVEGLIFEVTPGGDVVWQYLNPIFDGQPITQGAPRPAGAAGKRNKLFRAYRFAADHPALAGRDLTPGDYLELPAP